MALDEDKMFDGRLDVDIAIREGGCDAVFNLDVLGEGGDFTDFGIREDVHFAACVLQDMFAHGKEMAESVAPIGKSLGAVSVIREAGKEVFLCEFRRHNGFRPYQLVIRERENAVDHVAWANSGPIVRAVHPAMPVCIACVEHGDEWIDGAAEDLLFQQGACLRLQFVLKQPIDGCKIRGSF